MVAVMVTEAQSSLSMPYILSEIFDDYGNSLSKPTL